MTEIEEAHLQVLTLMMKSGTPDFKHEVAKLTPRKSGACIPIDTPEPIDDDREELRLNAERYTKLRENLTRLIVSTANSAGYHKFVDAIIINRDLPPPDLDSVDRAVDRLKP